jgi:glycosyltransferase involved in cell wall biosynthesis
MDNNPMISVLMPVYNGQDYLRPAIDSLLNQTFKDFEIILVNDGSTDDSQEIIDSYNDPRIITLKQKNQGVARSLNNGLKVAKGKYVRRHDADDISTPDSFQKQVDFLETHPDYVMVCNQQAFMTSNGKIAMNYRLPQSKFFQGKSVRDLTLDDFKPDRASLVVHGTACYRRQEVLDIGCYRPEFIVSEDNDLWMRLLEKYKIAILNDCSYFMRIHGQSATNRHANKIQYFRNLLQEYSQQRKETGTDPIMRGELIPAPPAEKPAEALPVKHPKGKYLREDLQYMYGLVLNAKDCRLIRKYGGEMLRDGWKIPKTYRLLLFPILGKGFVNAGVKIKGVFKRK